MEKIETHDTDARKIMDRDRDALRTAGCKCEKIVLDWDFERDAVRCACCKTVAEKA
jgi:hypothetical protein